MNLNEDALSADRTHQRELQAKDELLVDVINHLRHDWMNDIQVLYGYLRLNKHDKLLAFMEIIKQKAAKESLISRLGVTELIVYLQTFRIHCPAIELEVDIEPEFQLRGLPVDAERVAKLAIGVLDGFKRHTHDAPSGDTRYLQLEWNVQEEQLVLNFDYRGGYKEAALKDTLLRVVGGENTWPRLETESEYEPQWAAFTIRIPLIRD